MMTGHIKENHAILPVTFRTSERGDIVAPFIIDTGCKGYLTMAPERIAALGLAPDGNTQVFLADESSVWTNIFRDVILWNGAEISVDILELDSRPLLGIQLLRERRLTVEFTEGGLVTVKPL